MSDWKDKTDFEINKAVAEIEYTNAEEIPNECDAWTNNDTECQVIIKVGIDGFMFDPCNDPSDAWPIIIENEISTVFMCDDWECHALENGDEAFNTIDENALRAAMIVYLKINGVKL